MWFKGWTSCNNLFWRNPQTKKNNFIFCFKGKTATRFLLCTFQYLFPPSFALLQSFPKDAFSFTYDVRLISSWKTRQEYWNPTLCSVAMTEMRTLSSRKIKENIFLIFNSHLHRPHQTNKVCFSLPRLPDDDFDAGKNIPSGSLLFPFS